MPIAESAVLVAGFALAHAAWSVSDLPGGELLTPLAIVVRGEKRDLMRFEAPTQAEAIEGGKAKLSELKSEATSWAFAREGLFPIDGRKTDVIVIDVWSKETPSTVTFIQPFQPFATGHFKIMGPALVAVDGKLQGAEESERLVATLYRGVLQHPKAGSLWQQWYSK
jgi:hypothetical protein